MFHQELRSENSEIRLIRRRASSTAADNLDFEMTIVSLDKAPQYKAISYEWSDTVMQTAVTVNGHTWYISDSLYNALVQVFDAPDSDAWLWVDALCVNQHEIEEKNWQVAHMHQIFSGARSVFFCLGPEEENSDDLFEFLIPWGEQAAEAEMFPGLGIEYGFRVDPPSVTKNALAHRPFWNRSWIIQELLLAQDGWLLCGSYAMPLHDFWSIMGALSQVPRWLEDKPRIGDGYAFIPRVENLGMLGKDSRLKGYEADNTLYYFLTSRARKCNTLAEQGPFYQAREPVDIIYAFLGIAADRERLDLKPDYSKTTREVYTEATVAMLQRQPDKPILELASFPKGICDLPSWVPDWKRIGRYGVCDPISSLDGYQVFGTPQGIPDAEIVDMYTLRRKGFTCGTVMDVFELGSPSNDIETKARTLSDGLYRNRPGCLELMEHFLKHFAVRPSEEDPEVRLWRAISADLYRDKERMRGYTDVCLSMMRLQPLLADQLREDEFDYIWECSDLKGIVTRQMLIDAFVREAWEQTIQITRNRTLIALVDGRIALGPTAAEPGDCVTALSGSNVPIILRPEEVGYSYVGEAYVEGIMYGELMETEHEYDVFDIV
ncbi:hypothetical protein NLG97_g8910 [Lecanicillium saksenae]|uniref:Uncharacterized protein n=1 Tax=Lecanicillium saksenae TaxID=468837 RepID=A0ACC1QHI5_9HYPO|nr:hypothetical protein NLG97_g8910 [Lecanicillium saksenae]